MPMAWGPSPAGVPGPIASPPPPLKHQRQAPRLQGAALEQRALWPPVAGSSPGQPPTGTHSNRMSLDSAKPCPAFPMSSPVPVPSLWPLCLSPHLLSGRGLPQSSPRRISLACGGQTPLSLFPAGRCYVRSGAPSASVPGRRPPIPRLGTPCSPCPSPWAAGVSQAWTGAHAPCGQELPGLRGEMAPCPVLVLALPNLSPPPHGRPAQGKEPRGGRRGPCGSFNEMPGGYRAEGRPVDEAAPGGLGAGSGFTSSLRRTA